VLGAEDGSLLTALLLAQPDELVCYGETRHPQFERLRVLAGKTRLHFRRPSVAMAEMVATDLMVVNGRTSPGPLGERLRRQAGQVRRWVALVGGAAAAVDELLAQGGFRVEQRGEHAGVVILTAVGAEAATSLGAA
jgi:hypothetical protein